CDMYRLSLLIVTFALLMPDFNAPPSAQTGNTVGDTTLKAGDEFKDCDVCPEMVVVPAGSFTMGSPESEKGRNSWEGPQHAVTFARPFAIGKIEGTVDQFPASVQETHYDAAPACWTFENGKFDMRSGRSWRDPGFVQGGSNPATCLSWRDGQAYVGWLEKKTGKGYRLPTEAEWE